jgi:hypothetical protein
MIFDFDVIAVLNEHQWIGDISGANGRFDDEFKRNLSW